jgi:molecular chaperone DnaJ
MEKRDYYEVLGLGRDASADDIKSAYRKLAAYYRDKGMPEKIDELRKSAESLNSASKASILRSLEQN